jgi:uncharacterized protein YjbI with pentapeptide repeats
MNCKYEGFMSEGCKEDAEPGEEYCIIHLPIPDTNDPSYNNVLNLKYKKIEEKIGNNDFNFFGAIMLGLNVNGREIQDNVNFISAKINGDLNFRGNFIKGYVSFADADITRNVIFENSVIEEDVSFALSNIKNGSIFFEKTTIGGDVDLGSANIEGYLDFKDSKIYGKADFGCKYVRYDVELKNIIIDQRAKFDNIEVGGYISLENAFIGGNVNFSEAKLGTSKSTPDGNYSYLTNMNIGGEAEFIYSEFFGESYFSKSNFRENVFLGGVTFNEKVDFDEVRFHENVDFSENIFKKMMNFSKASFLSTGLFKKINNGNKFSASFEDTRLHNVAFRDCNLSKITFKNAIFENCELSTSKWDNDIIFEHREYEKKKIESLEKLQLSNLFLFINEYLCHSLTPELNSEAIIVSDTYRRIRQSLQQQGSYQKPSKFYVEEMNLRREGYSTNNKGIWLLYTILSATSEYGENLKRIGLILIVYLLIYSTVLYYYPENKLIIPVFSGLLSFITAIFVYVFARKMSR